MTLDVISFSPAISAGEKGGQWPRAWLLLEGIHKVGVTLDIISFGAAVLACGKGGQWQRACSLLWVTCTACDPSFGNLCRSGRAQNVVSSCAMISHGQWQRALSLLDSMHTASVTQNVISLNAVTSA